MSVKLVSIYVIYHPQDMELVEKLMKMLGGSGLRVNYDLRLPESTDIRREAMEKRLAFSGVECILILLTRNSYSSELFSWDIGFALEMVGRSEGNQTIIPVLYGEVGLDERLAVYQAVNWRDNIKGGDREAMNNIVEMVRDFSSRDRYAQNVQQESPQVEFSFSGKNNYWIFALPGPAENENIITGDKEKLNKDDTNESDYILFDQITEGDRALLFIGTPSNLILAELIITTGVTLTDVKEGPWIELSTVKMLEPGIPLEKFRQEVPEIFPELENYTADKAAIFPIDEATYNTILSSGTRPEGFVIHDYQPFYLTEGDFRKTEDQLEFENDINSFASVIALKTVTPPLAIGLFGNWGSGKSFFMEKLSARIEELARPEYPDYVDHVVHVKFNSWHYSDANLWASLISQIFESLNDFAKKKEYGTRAVEQIFDQLNITSRQLEEIQKKINANQVREAALNEQKSNVEKIIEHKKETLEMWKARDLVGIVFSDPFIQKDFENIKGQFNEENLIDNIHQIDEKIDQLGSVWRQISESFKMLRENRSRQWIIVWVLAVLFAICGWLVLGPFKNAISEFIDAGIVASGLSVVWLVNLITKISPYINKLNQFLNRIKSLKQTIEKKKDEVRLKEHEVLAQLNSEINDLTAQQAELETAQREIENQKTKLEKELRDIGSGRMLAEFLATRSTDDLYLKQLGIISWIRKDFEKLNDLFKKQEAVKKDRQEVPIEVRIDRIVLYIDDLDRCNEDVVVKVLEAIHLLLAFPLFVVIVGVDPRWLNNALSEKYRNLFGTYANQKPATQQGQDAGQQDVPLLTGIATSYDYLEKIFQIPFVLKPINETGRKNLISYLMKDEMKKEPVRAETPTGAEPSPIEKPVTPPDVPPLIEPAEVDKTKSEPVQFENMTEQQKQEQAVKMKEKLEFSLEERDYMQSISALFGRTPRSINRYINIYRIIKAHGSMKVTGDFSRDEFVPIMFILGVIVGYGAYAEGFIAEIAKTEDEATFHEFIEESAINQKLKDEINKLSADVDGIPMKDFKRNLDLISRFSFRTLIKAL